jgi:hypothetical protein
MYSYTTETYKQKSLFSLHRYQGIHLLHIHVFTCEEKPNGSQLCAGSCGMLQRMPHLGKDLVVGGWDTVGYKITNLESFNGMDLKRQRDNSPEPNNFERRP